MIVTRQLSDEQISLGYPSAAEAELGATPVYVTYGDYSIVSGHVEGTTERIGHFLREGEPYPDTAEELRVILQRIVA
jgi:hypothetical protein